jgi:DNA repair protein RadC
MGKTYRRGKHGRVRENTRRQQREERTEETPGIPRYAQDFDLAEAFSPEELGKDFSLHLESLAREPEATYSTVSERLAMNGAQSLNDGELLQVLTGTASTVTPQELQEIAWQTADRLRAKGFTKRQAALLCAAFEIGRRGAWAPPKRGERCLDARRVYELMRFAAHEQVESFFVVLLDVRGRLLRQIRVAQGSLTQCPVNPRDALRPAVAEGAHSVVFVHNHPSGDPSPSADDADLTERIKAAAEIVGIVPRDHVIVSAGGYYSFVEAGRWRR